MTDPNGGRPAPRAPALPAADADGDRDARWRAGMAAAQGGDEVAYRKLLEELLPVVRRQVRARVSAAQDAEDIVQNALIAIHRGRRTYRPERPFGPWMRTIVRHCVIDHFRERGRRGAREFEIENPDWFPDERAPEDPDRGRLSKPVADALARLPASQREAVELIQLQGLSVAEAAVRAGVSPGALKVRAHRGYKALRGLLDGVEL